MRILFLTDGPYIPSGRFRVEQFVPALQERGFDCVVRYAYGPRYNDLIGSPVAPVYKAVCRLRRAAHTVIQSGFDLVFLQRTAIPMTAFPELLRSLRGSRVVFDFDDAIYLGPGGRPSPFRQRAFQQAVRLSDHVIAGNRHLAAKAAVPQKTSVIPTVVDTSRYVPSPQRARGEGLVIGWMGTASNFPSLRLVIPDLLAVFEQNPNARLKIVSNARLEELRGNPRVEQVSWSASSEIRELQSFDVGLMPLEDNELTRGKCGFKMLQYMSVGVPVVASAVGANPELFEASNAGYLVSPGEDWKRPLLELLRSRERRMEMGAAGLKHVRSRYSIPVVIDQMVSIFEGVVQRGSAK